MKTVKDVIEELSKFPLDDEVVLLGLYEDLISIEAIKFDEVDVDKVVIS